MPKQLSMSSDSPDRFRSDVSDGKAISMGPEEFGYSETEPDEESQTRAASNKPKKNAKPDKQKKQSALVTDHCGVKGATPFGTIRHREKAIEKEGRK